MDSIEHTIKEIETKLISLSTEEGKQSIYKFVPHSKKVYGVRMPDLNQIAKEYKGNHIELSKVLWKKGAYEEKMLAAKLLERASLKESELILKTIDKFKKDIDNWAVCDALGMQGIRKPIKKIPDEVLRTATRYTEDTNPWTIRLGLVYMVYFARNGQNLKTIKMISDSLAKHPDYYVRKAVVWVRSNLAKHE